MTRLMDPWVRMLVFDMMEIGGAWHIKGAVSKSCLRNMERFVEYWHQLKPDKCPLVDFQPESVYDDSAEPTDDSAILPFSGGVDASYTAYRHLNHLAGYKNMDVRAAMMVHGADIPLHNTQQFDLALAHNRAMLADLGLEKVHVIRTNYRLEGTCRYDWGEFTHMAVLIGLASFLSPMYKNVVIGSSDPYSVAPLDWGDNPVSDYMLASRMFNVHVDDFAKHRTEKAELLCHWKVGMEKLRVCWESALTGTQSHNCGHCEKCIRTNLNFLACGVQLPCLSVLSLQEIAANRGEIHLLREYKTMLEYARIHQPDAPWLKALEGKVRRCEARLRWPRLFKRIWNKVVYKIAAYRFRNAVTKEQQWARHNFIRYNTIP